METAAAAILKLILVILLVLALRGLGWLVWRCTARSHR